VERAGIIFSIKHFRKLRQDLSSIPFFDEFNELTKKGFFAELCIIDGEWYERKVYKSAFHDTDKERFIIRITKRKEREG
jgi:hypothetical protein